LIAQILVDWRMSVANQWTRLRDHKSEEQMAAWFFPERFSHQCNQLACLHGQIESRRNITALSPYQIDVSNRILLRLPGAAQGRRLNHRAVHSRSNSKTRSLAARACSELVLQRLSDLIG